MAMRRYLRFFTLTASMALAGCSSLSDRECAPVPAAGAAGAAGSAGALAQNVKGARAADVPAERVVVEDRAGRVEVQKVEFRPGVSSATVERLAKNHGCSGRTGAGLLTAKGPVEVYRMQCDSGSVFMARCEFRQCRPMH